jgi:hypothetical protein
MKIDLNEFVSKPKRNYNFWIISTVILFGLIIGSEFFFEWPSLSNQSYLKALLIVSFISIVALFIALLQFNWFTRKKSLPKRVGILYLFISLFLICCWVMTLEIYSLVTTSSLSDFKKMTNGWVLYKVSRELGSRQLLLFSNIIAGLFGIIQFGAFILGFRQFSIKKIQV